MSDRLKANLQLAKRAVQFVDGLRLKSTNVPFRTTYEKFSPLDDFLLWAMRAQKTHVVQETITVPNPYGPGTRTKTVSKVSNDVGHNRAVVLGVLRDPKLGKADKRRQLTEFMNALGQRYFREHGGWFKNNDNVEYRIRACRKALKNGYGNCGEKSALAATWLTENNPDVGKKILWIDCGNVFNHAFVLLDFRVGYNPGSKTLISPQYWNDEAVVVDPWTSDYYQAKNPLDLRRGNSFPNPFQLYVRRQIRLNASVLNVMDDVQYGATAFDPTFKLSNGHLKKADRPQERGRQYAFDGDDWAGVDLSQLQGVADNAESLLAQVA